MTHLSIFGKPACKSADTTVLPYKEIEGVTCPACRESLHGKAAERILDAESHFTATRMLATMARRGTPRITGRLGDASKVDATAPGRIRMHQMHETMSDAEKVEAFRRVTEMAADTCPGCGGSIREKEHTPTCLGPDPTEWPLSDDEVRAELEVMGIDAKAAGENIRRKVQDMLDKHRAGISKLDEA